MKDQASLNLLIVDNPIDNKALTGHLMLRATSSGLKLLDETGTDLSNKSSDAIIHYGEDFNNFIETGIYYLSSYHDQCPNAPDRYSYMLRVEKCEEDNFSRVFQTATRYVDSDQATNQKTFIRNGYRESQGGELIWNNWTSYSDESSSPRTVSIPVIIQFAKPKYNGSLHLEITSGTNPDGSDNESIFDSETNASDRSKMLANAGNTDWITCPEGGLGSVYDLMPVRVDLTEVLSSTTVNYLRYRWKDTANQIYTDWYSTIYPAATEVSTGSSSSSSNVVVSATEPENPTDGMIWIESSN